MLTIVTGPDGCGKTTFAEWYMERSSYGGIDHHGAYPGEVNTARFYAASIARAWTEPIVMDRAWMEEPLYGQAFRNGQDRIGVAFRRMLERCALSARAVAVVFLPPKNVCVSNWEQRRGREYLEHEHQLTWIHDAYWEFLSGKRRCDLPMLHYDYTVSNPEELEKMIGTYRPIANEGPGIGAWRPGHSILMVGERPARGSGFGLPFVSYRKAGCAAWLAEQLESESISENELYWVNALKPNGDPLDGSFIEHLQPRATIALGDVAAAWLHARQSPDYHTVDDPRYWKRFHEGRRYPLLDVIQEVQRAR